MKKSIAITTIIILLLSSIAFAITVSHPASELTPGQFASGTFSFPGNVGIGTANPNYKLDVAGSINAQTSLCINGDCKTSWPTGESSSNISGVPYGTIAAFVGTSCPIGWIYSDGSAGTPDLRGRTIVGIGTGTDINSVSKTFTVGSTGGEYNHTLSVTEMPSHNHPLLPGSATAYILTGTGSYSYGSGGSTFSSISSTQNNGNGIAHNIMQPYTSLIYCMKVSDDSNATASLFSKNGNNVYLSNTSQNLGVGTTSPGFNLDVRGSTGDQVYIKSTAPSANQYGGILIQGNGSSGGMYMNYGDSSTSSVYYKHPDAGTIATTGGKNLYLNAGGIESMVIKSDGYVGIGVANPTYKLDVNGAVRIKGESLYTGIDLRNSAGVRCNIHASGDNCAGGYANLGCQAGYCLCFYCYSS